MKLLHRLLPLPQIAASMVLEVFPPKTLRYDLNSCIAIAGKHGAAVPEAFVKALIIAEDHRNSMHPGIDVIAMIRALWVKVARGQTQGASTIEQQFVRVISNRRERTFARKLREQVLALMVSRRVEKYEIASAYLSISFYGSGSIGIEGLKAKFGSDLSAVSVEQALRMVAQLKYPRPHCPGSEWRSKIEPRYRLLLLRVEGAAVV